MAIEIVSLPSYNMAIFRSYVNVYQSLVELAIAQLNEVAQGHNAPKKGIEFVLSPSFMEISEKMTDPQCMTDNNNVFQY
jgi:hypothetical protein